MCFAFTKGTLKAKVSYQYILYKIVNVQANKQSQEKNTTPTKQRANSLSLSAKE